MNSLGNHIAITNSLTDLPPGGLTQYLGAVLFTLGGLAFMFLVPALAGYISFAIADRPALRRGSPRVRSPCSSAAASSAASSAA